MTVVEKDQETVEETQGPVDLMLTDTVEKYKIKLEEYREPHEAFIKLEGMIRQLEGIHAGTIKLGKRGTSATADRASRGQRPQEFMDIVRAAGDEGITVAEATPKMMGMNANYLYRIAKELVESGSLLKRGKRYVTA